MRASKRGGGLHETVTDSDTGSGTNADQLKLCKLCKLKFSSNSLTCLEWVQDDSSCFYTLSWIQKFGREAVGPVNTQHCSSSSMTCGHRKSQCQQTRCGVCSKAYQNLSEMRSETL